MGAAFVGVSRQDRFDVRFDLGKRGGGFENGGGDEASPFPFDPQCHSTGAEHLGPSLAQIPDHVFEPLVDLDVFDDIPQGHHHAVEAQVGASLHELMGETMQLDGVVGMVGHSAEQKTLFVDEGACVDPLRTGCLWSLWTWVPPWTLIRVG